MESKSCHYAALLGLAVGLLLLACPYPATARASKSRRPADSKTFNKYEPGAPYKTKWNINRPFNVTLGMFEKLGFAETFENFNPATRVKTLEVGCGEGRAMLELQSLLPMSEVHCLNSDTYGRQRGFHGANLGGSRKNLQPVIDYYGIKLKNDALPNVSFGDAFTGKWPYEDRTFNSIFSSHCFTKNIMHMMKSMSEIARVLMPGGEAFLHVAMSGGQRLNWKADGCHKFSKEVPTLLYCKNFERFTVFYKIVFGNTEHVRVGAVRDPNQYYGIIHVIKRDIPCPDVDYANIQRVYDPSVVECFNDKGRIYQDLKKWDGKP